MFEDDFELEDQPADIRDRNVSGGRRPRGGQGRRPGGGMRNGNGNGNAPRGPRVKAELPEVAKPARDLLEDILTQMGVPHVEIEYVPRPEGEYFEVTGPD
ncbi:MAG TPA: hypothetical protein VIO32_01425, partial [Candidatus Baltobacteraceae bacterium]